MSEPDFLENLAAGRDAIRRLQQSFSRYAMSAEQRQALAGGFAQLMFPSDGVRALSDLVDAFGPPLAQVEALRAELAEQRELLSKLDERLEHLESSAERLALAGEQILAFQEPFIQMAGLVTGQGRSRSTDDRQPDHDEPDDHDDGEAPTHSR